MKKVRLLTVVFALFAVCLKAQDVEIFSLEGGEITADYGNTVSLKKLIDNDVNTYYEFDGLPNNIIFKAPDTFCAKKFVLVSSSLSADKDPKDMELSGSLDGTNWESIRKVSNFSFSERKQLKSVSLNSSQPYQYFKLNITGVKLEEGKSAALAEWRLSGEQKSLPRKPTDARANPLAYNQVKVSWRDFADNEDGYQLQRSSDGKNYVKIADLPSNTTSHVDNDVDASSSYTYRVCAMSDGMRTIYAVSNTVQTLSFPAMTLLMDGRSYNSAEQWGTSPVGEKVGCAFDADPTTKYLTRNKSTWLRVDFAEAVAVKQYSLTSANDNPTRDPKSWRLEGSMDGSKWEVLDTRTNEKFEARFRKRFFEIENDKKYLSYKLTIGINNGDANTQIADWLLYADVPVVSSGQTTPETPTDFQIEVRAYHHVKLSWNDVAHETSYRIERSDDGGHNFNYTYDIPANNTESYPYSLKPETDYVFKLYALNGDKESAPVTVRATTPKREFVDKWENYNLWILDEPATFTKVKQIGNTAFYMIEGYSVEDVDELYYDFYASNWDYVFECYGEELSDSRLHVLLIPTEGGGGLASIYDYRSSGGNYSNMVYIKANKDWFKKPNKSGYAYDVMAHELCHIIEGVGGGYNLSMYYTIWGDSKWAEILQYDIFKALGSPRAESWHSGYTEGDKPGGGTDYPTEGHVSYWYRDFFYPTYAAYGETEVLKRFWKLQKEHYRMKNGNFQGSSENPGGRGNLGELIHFWSGACGVDVKPYAVKAFTWNEQYETWLQRAKQDYPGITYKEQEIDGSVKNICQNGGAITSNMAISDKEIQYFIDNNYLSYYLVKAKDEVPAFELTYSSPLPAVINEYTVAVRNEVAPASWVLHASLDGQNWVVLNRQDAPKFTDNKLQVPLQNEEVYKYYKFEFHFADNEQIRLAEIELLGVEHISAPVGLRVQKITDETVYLDWSADIAELDHYEVERSQDGVNFFKVADVSCYEISYTDVLPHAGAYYYRVAAVNKSDRKNKVYSNVCYIDSSANGLVAVDHSASSFHEIITHLGDYPENRVSILTVGGSELYSGFYPSNDLMEHMKTHFAQGVYVVSIRTGAYDKNPVIGKVMVWW